MSKFKKGDIVQIITENTNYSGYYGIIVRESTRSVSGSYGVEIPLGDDFKDRLSFWENELDLVVSAKVMKVEE